MTAKGLSWMQTLPCGCQDMHLADGTTDREHDHVDCPGLPEPGAPVLSEPVFGPDHNVDYVTEWYCDPPLQNVPFRVAKEYWRDGKPPVREIHTWQPAT